jgi:hypothetical protein
MVFMGVKIRAERKSLSASDERVSWCMGYEIKGKGEKLKCTFYKKFGLYFCVF